MAKSTGKRRKDGALGASMITIIALLLLLTVGGAAVFTTILGYRSAREAIASSLRGTLSGQTAFQQLRFQQLQHIARIFKTDPVLTSYLAESVASAASADDEGLNVVPMLDLVEEYQNVLTFDLAVVLDRNGRVLTRTDDHDASGDDLSTSSLVATALEDDEAFGVWEEEGKLFHAMAVPLVRDFELVGYVLVALAIDDSLALRLERISGASAVYLASSATGPTVVTTTLDRGVAEELISELRLRGDVLAEVMTRGRTREDIELEIDGQAWLALMTPLRDAEEKPVGAVVALRSMEELRAGYKLISLYLAGTGLVALLVGSFLALIVARRASGPVRKLARAAEPVGRGNLEIQIPTGFGGDVGSLASSLRALASELRGKRMLSAFLGHVARALPEPAKSEGSKQAVAQKVALVVIELRRFANPKVGYDPQESLARFGRDLRRVALAVEVERGAVGAVFGHRILTIFEGDDATRRSLVAATEVLSVLSQRENVFDEPQPPVVALTGGDAVTGSLSWGRGASSAVIGLTVQLLETLLREATPGEIYLSKPSFNELNPLLTQAGISLSPQRGIVSTQPLYILSLEQAAAVTGVKVKSETLENTFPEERASLSEIGPGTVLGRRFEILADLGAFPLGVVFKARDQERNDLVMLKLLKPEVVADVARLERLKGLIRQVRMINHSNVLRIFDFGEADGLPYILTEYVRGMSLRYVLQQSRQIPVGVALGLARPMAAGLRAAHEESVLHGSLKPESILVEAGGGVRITDFGLGTGPSPQYMAPEILDGGTASVATEVYAYGAILYEMCTGRPPVTGSSAAEIRRKLQQEQPAAPSSLCADMPPELEQLILRAIALKPTERYPSMEPILQALGSIRA